jgi:excisionase family DNA binding protein
MSKLLDRERLAPPELTEEETQMVKAAEKMLMKSLDHSRAATITVEAEDGTAPTVAVPPQVLKVIAQALGLMAQGRPIVLMPEKQELSTVEAANFLNVSRPFVIKEIDAGRLKHRMVGSHRRILYTDLLEYARAMRTDQESALDEMAEDARSLGLDY